MNEDADINVLPWVHELQGLHFELPDGADPQLGAVRMQYTDQSGKWHSLALPTPQALYLMSLLREWAADERLDPRYPPPA